jgi:hypothetical protein
MTGDDIIRLAREAAEATNTIVPPEGPLFVTPFIERFAALVAAAEREACARLCDELVERNKADAHVAWVLGNSQCADAIRARGEQA